MKRDLPKWLWASVVLITAILIGAIDTVTGFELSLFVFYFLPVSIAAWYISRNASVWAGVVCAIIWFGADVISGHSHSWHFYAVWNTTVRLISFLVIGVLVSRIRRLLVRQRGLTEDLQRSISEIKVLETFLPICSQCKKIRTREGTWQQLEEYITEHSNTLFSHGYCPECAGKAMVEAGLVEK